MAKKRFNISSTLNKNKDKEPTPLAAKIPLKKSTKDTEEVAAKVAEIHQEEVKEKTPEPVAKEAVEPKATKRAQTKKTSRKTTAQKQEPKAEKLVRLTIDTPMSMHKRLKIHAIEEGVSMRDFILNLIERNLE